MAQSELEQFRLKIKQDYVRLLDLLCRVLGESSPLSTTDLGDRERLSIAQGLTDKFVNHAVTLLYLSRGTKQDLPSFKFGLYDFASIDVLTRVLLEACLTFHYVFYAPTTKEEKGYRYGCYKAAGIAERQNAPASTEEYRQKQAEEREELNKLHGKLTSSTIFQSLTDNQKKRILRGEWRLKSWREIAIDAGFSKILASDMYRSLSGQAHSSFLSVLQSLETQKTKKQEETIISSMGIINPVIANMVREYCELFPKAEAVLRGSNASEFVKTWVHIGRRLDENLDIGQDSD